MSSDREDASQRDVLLNRTTDGDEYESLMKKRNSIVVDKATLKRNWTIKVVTISAIFLIGAILLGVVIGTLANKEGHSRESEQDYNMFKMISQDESLQMVSVELKTKLPAKTSNAKR
jgi:hypothetical protein